MHTLFAALYDFPAGWALAIFVGFHLFEVIVINLLIIIIETVLLKIMKYGKWLSCFGASFFMNLVSASAGFFAGYIVKVILDKKEFVTVLARLPSLILKPLFALSTPEITLFLITCYTLTIFLEFLTLYIFDRINTAYQIGKFVLMTNLFSYLFLIIVFGLAKVYFS